MLKNLKFPLLQFGIVYFYFLVRKLNLTTAKKNPEHTAYRGSPTPENIPKNLDLSPSLPFMLPFKFAPTLQTKYQGLIGCERNFECQYFQIWSFAENKNKWHTFFIFYVIYLIWSWVGIQVKTWILFKLRIELEYNSTCSIFKSIKFTSA